MAQRPTYPTVCPYVMSEEPETLAAFLTRVFDATPVSRPLLRPDGSVRHVAMRIGDSVVMIGGVGPGEGAPSFVHVYVDDPDATHAKAVAAGASVVRDVRDEEYGDRAGGVRGPGGDIWWIASFREQVAPDEIERRHRERS